MKKKAIYAALAALALCGCAKAPTVGSNDSTKLYFDSWIHVYHPDATPLSLGSYVLSEKAGTGAAAGTAEQNAYVRMDYVIRSLDGTISSTSREDVAQQVGTYEETDYYGPVIWARGENYLSAGLDDAITPMRVGGTRTVAVPGWLNTTARYDTLEEYMAKVTGTSSVFDLELVEVIPDVKKWETDSVGRYVSRNFPGKSVADSLKYGFYYFRTGNPSSEKEFKNDTTIYINYVARLLNGNVFDTNVKDTAKFYGLYSASRTYAPSKITWFSSDGTYADIKMGESSVIDGFSYALSKMHPHEKGAAVFYSGIGYGSSGSGSSIPAYASLRFDIEIVDKP
jgi:FKBP-type peptidyl-prolyl cis-trans isomerase